MTHDRKKTLQYIFVQVLTLGRIPLILIFLAVSLFKPTSEVSSGWFALAFYSMILSAVTDLLDGYFARLFKVTSRLGAYADPLTDKVFYLTALPTLVFLAGVDGDTGHAQLLLGMTILFLMRDQWVSFLRSIGALHNMDGKANWSGKARTVISFPAICIIYYYLRAPESWWFSIHPYITYSVEGISIAINLISIWVYTAYYWPCLKKEFRPGIQE